LNFNIQKGKEMLFKGGRGDLTAEAQDLTLGFFVNRLLVYSFQLIISIALAIDPIFQSNILGHRYCQCLF